LLADVSTARADGEVAKVHEVATQLYAIDPQNDVAALAIAEQYLMRGDSRGAIGLLRQHITTAKDELQRDVPKQVARVLRRVEQGLVPVAGVDDAVATALPYDTAKRDVFVGRDEELSRLEALWAKVRNGNLVTCLISGAAGIGKSTLITRFATTVLARGLPAYLVSCQEMGRNIPFATVSDLTCKLARDPGASATDPQSLAEASRVTPGLRAVYTGIPDPLPTPPETVRLRVADALIRILAAVADGGATLVALDDIQYLDPASKDIVHVLARRLESTPTLLLATIRSTGPGRSMMGVEASEVVDWQEELCLGTMDKERIQEMVRGLTELAAIPETVCLKMAELSQGNPYLTEMLVSDWRNSEGESLVAAALRGEGTSSKWRPPDTMRKAFSRQHKGLSRDAEHMLHLLAVAERAIPMDEIESLLTLEPGVGDRAALELIDRAIVRTSSGTLGFRNEPHRAFVYRVMGDEARTYYHARIARSLTGTAEEEDFQRALEASLHYLKAGMNEEAVATACAGADAAVTHGAPKEAERVLKAVLPSCPQGISQQVQILLAQALSSQQRYRESLEALPNRNSYSGSREPAHSLSIRAEALHRGRLADTDSIAKMIKEAIRQANREANQSLALSGYQALAEMAHENEWQDEVEKVEGASM
jgi:predicted ATPase